MRPAARTRGETDLARHHGLICLAHLFARPGLENGIGEIGDLHRLLGSDGIGEIGMGGIGLHRSGARFRLNEFVARRLQPAGGAVGRKVGDGDTRGCFDCGQRRSDEQHKGGTEAGESQMHQRTPTRALRNAKCVPPHEGEFCLMS